MKKLILVAAIMSICMYSFAVITSVTVEWSNTVGGCVGNPSFVTYNWATNHFLVCDYSAPEVRIADNVNGSLTGATLSKAGLNLGNLGVFSICATTDGVIYGGTNILTGGGEGNSLIRWENETATPTQQDPAAPLGVNMEFPRAMDAVGTGADTIIGVTGSNDYKVTFLTTTDGVNFAVTDYTPIASTNVREQIKQSVALVPSSPTNITRVYGTKADGSGEVCRLDKVDGVWAAAAGFNPPPSYSAPPTGLGAASPIGYAPGHNAVFVIGYTDAANDYLTVLDGDTGAVITQLQTGVNLGTYGYGTIDLNEEAGVGYFGARASAANTYVCGKITFDVYVPPTPTPTPGPSPTPSPTPLGVTSAWGLYE